MSARGAVPATLPPFTVRRSSRARRVRLVVTARAGLEVVVPETWPGDPAAVVASKQAWANRALEQIAEEHALHLAGAEALLPHQIELRADGLLLPVEYRQGSGERVSARHFGGAVVVSGAIEDAEKCLAALRRWLGREAASILTARCEQVARETGLTPARIRVSATRTRWGSCSARGVVMLSRNLLFLPSELVDALICHELAHLRVLDHSPRFWSFLGELDEHALAHRVELRRAAGFVPAWADA